MTKVWSSRLAMLTWANQSKNNSRTWFDTAACANALNLRAYCERRKAARFSDLSERDPG